MSVALVVLTLVLTGSAFYGGISKLLGAGSTLNTAAHLGFSSGAFVKIGALETCGGIGLAAGLVAWPLGVAAATGLACLLIGAFTVHLRAGDPPAVAAPAAVVGVLELAVIALHLAVNA